MTLASFSRPKFSSYEGTGDFVAICGQYHVSRELASGGGN
jgi:hypothetical protein